MMASFRPASPQAVGWSTGTQCSCSRFTNRCTRQRQPDLYSHSLTCRSSIRPVDELQHLLRPSDVQQLTQQQQHASSSSSSRNSDSSSSGNSSSTSLLASRRQVAVVLPAAGTLLLGFSSLFVPASPAAASKLGGLVDSVWQDMGGGPADLTFPESWLGVWDVTSTLVSVELPLGEAVVPNIASVKRAQEQDLQKPIQYQVAFMRNPSGSVIYDRRFNTAALLASYYGSNVDFAGRINWDPKDPNALTLDMPGLSVRTRVMRRSEEQTSPARFETSEFMQQVFETDPARPRVKASQCFTKYLWRDEAAAAAGGGPAIVATQVVSDYLTPFDSEVDAIRYANKPITTYTYKVAFSRHHAAGQVASALSAS